MSQFKHSVDFKDMFSSMRVDNSFTLQDLAANISASLIAMIRMRMNLTYPHHPYTGEFYDVDLKALFADLRTFYHKKNVTQQEFNALYQRILAWCDANNVYVYQ